MNVEELNALPYRELQKRAKELKVKANQPKEALIKAILGAAEVESVESDLNRTFEVPSTSPTPKAASPGLNSTFSLDEPSFIPNENTPPATSVSRRSTPRPRKTATPLRPIATGTPSSRALHKTLPGSSSINHRRKSSFVPKSVLKKAAGLATPSSSTLGSPGVKFKHTPGSSRLPKPTQTTFSSKLPRKKVPDFAKIHAEQFKKMDTLENYLQKKQERIARVMTPGKTLAQNDRLERKSPRMAMDKRPMDKLTVGACKPPPQAAPNSSLVTTRKQPVLSVSQTSFNFGTTSTSQPNQVFLFNAKRTSTPSKRLNSTQPCGTPGSASRKFDAKPNLASKKPLAYQPYSGKLKPWDPKKKLEERKLLAAKTRPTTKPGQIQIRGVRLNRRVELMLQKKNA